MATRSAAVILAQTLAFRDIPPPIASLRRHALWFDAVLFLFALWATFRARRSIRLSQSVALGVLFGFGLLSRTTIAAFMLLACAWLVWQWRRPLRVSLPHVALILGIAYADYHNGTGTFTWTPSPQDSGCAQVKFHARVGLTVSNLIVYFLARHTDSPPNTSIPLSPPPIYQLAQSRHNTVTAAPAGARNAEYRNARRAAAQHRQHPIAEHRFYLCFCGQQQPDHRPSSCRHQASSPPDIPAKCKSV